MKPFAYHNQCCSYTNKPIPSIYLLILIILLSCVFPVQSQDLKESVFIIKGVYTPEIKSSLLSIADEFESEGYTEQAKAYREMAEGSGGSGFLVQGNDGTPVVVTNRHVVRNASTVSIVQEDKEGKQTSYEGKILYIDPNLDLAVLSFKEGTSFKKTLPLATTGVNGDEVWAAGYPGILEKQSWQLSKGIISNNHAQFDKIKNSSSSYFIQHTAAIHGGNSGGPLLAKKGGGFTVIGVNTWIIAGNQALNYSIPASDINIVLTNAQQNRLASEEELQNAAKQFVQLLNESDSGELARFIDYSWVSEQGWNSLKAILYSYNTNSRLRREWFDYIDDEGLIGGMRRALAYKLIDQLKSRNEEISFDHIDQFDAEGNSIVFMNINGRIRKSVWVHLHGRWMVSDFRIMASRTAH